MTLHPSTRDEPVNLSDSGLSHPPAGRNPAPRYLWAAEVAEILEVSPKTVSRWAKEGKLPFLRTLAATGAIPAAEIRQLADQLQVQPTA